MPTFNQLVRKGRKTAEKKYTAPALLAYCVNKKVHIIEVESCPKYVHMLVKFPY